ncbi:Hypothetical predicted protein [Olea europaea subsp. europaea]|uniref:Uncharacterized protein n=1 Tax=Olea europaea subsp. europaea TaxID=158383 RepID=A0A8S0T8F5_OLEEU|nr:Hypothetical predicted protein [Olea europaea subsp. europaea]
MQSNPIENRIKDVEERIKTNEEVMERLQILECKVEKMLASNEGQMKYVASPSNKGRIELFLEVELKDDVWEKVVEVMATIEAETEIEEENVETIDIDNVISDMHLKRQKKPRVLLQSPWVNEFDSTSGTNKCVVKGTFAFPIGVGPPMARDVDAFKLWLNKGLVKKNNGDYGIYVIKYAQYFINGMLNEMPKSFNVPHLRRNLAAQLYAYGKKKQDAEYDTDNEWVSKEME